MFARRFLPGTTACQGRVPWASASEGTRPQMRRTLDTPLSVPGACTTSERCWAPVNCAPPYTEYRVCVRLLFDRRID